MCTRDKYGRGDLVIIKNIPHIEFVDNYEHPNKSVEYLIQNLPYEPLTSNERNSPEFQDLTDRFNTIFTKNCKCSNSTECKESSNSICFHGGNYTSYFNTVVGSEELILNEQHCSHHKGLIYECSNNCDCLPTCLNRLLQYGPRDGLHLINAKNLNKSRHQEQQHFGLATSRVIPKGGFICEYVGEILTRTEAERRHAEQKRTNQMNYIICLNEWPDTTKTTAAQLSDEEGEENVSEKEYHENSTTISKDDTICSIVASTTSYHLQTFIDPSRKGNIGRYLNHSCSPNCEILSVRVDGPLPRLGIFAKRCIVVGEELCFHYSGNEGTTSSSEIEQLNCREDILIDRILCLCQSNNCTGFLPNLQF